jgi:hypothetical protein
MAEDEEEKEKTTKDWFRILFPRILKALVMGMIMGGEILILLNLPQIGGTLTQFFPKESTSISYFFAVYVIIEVAIQLLDGTIFPYALSVARALISMFVLVLVTNGGMFTIPIPTSPELPIPSDMSVTFSVDFRAVLGIFLLLALVSLIKNMLQAVNFLSEKAEEPVIPPELP